MTDDVTITAPGEDPVEQDDRPLIDPETGWHRLLVEQMARDIQIAHSVDGGSWSVMASNDHSDDVILSVGGIWMAKAVDGSNARILIDAGHLTDEQRAKFTSVMKRRVLTTEGMQTAADVSLSIDTIPDALASLAGNHEQLVREQAERASRGRQVSGWHRRRLLEEIERITGKILPKPDFVAKLSWLEETFDLELLHHLAEDIKLIHAIRPSSWALYSLRPRAITLGVQNIAALWLTEDDCGVYLDGRRNDEPYLSALSQDADVDTFPKLSTFRVRKLTREQMATCLRSFAIQHRDAITQLASSVTTQTMLSRNHNPLLVEELGRIVGFHLPQPHRIGNSEVTQGETSVSVGSGADAESLMLIKQNVRESGLQYTDDQIATFYTALQTKGFVVLSGISGTGKSKIAQGFVDMLPTPET